VQQVNNHIVCRSCQAIFVDGAPFERVLRLPSTYWQELAELWGCHTEKFEAAPNQPITTRPGVFYLGDTFVGLHSRHVKGVSSDAAGHLACSSCHEPVGYLGAPPASYLYLHAIDNGRGLWMDRTLCSRLASVLLDTSRGSGERRFVVPATGLRLVLLNWDTGMAVESGAAVRPVLKLRYSVGEAKEEEGDDFGGWTPMRDWNAAEGEVFRRQLESNRQRFVPASLATLPAATPDAGTMSFVWM
jgi:hypothetical protein